MIERKKGKAIVNKEDNILQEDNESKENSSSQKDNGHQEDSRQQEKNKKLRKLKGFLENNKIYFETIIPLVVPIIALVLSIISMVTSYNANRISEELRDITKQQVLPVIDIASVYDDDGNLTALQVFNNGGEIDNVNVTIYPYIYFDMLIAGGRVSVHRQGICPVDIVLDDITGKQHVKGVFKELATHTKSNMLYEVSNTDLMEHVSEVMKYVWDKDIDVYLSEDNQVILKIVVGNKEAQSEFEGGYACIIRLLSLEYILEISYRNGVDSEEVTEKYRVVTGTGYPNYVIPNISKDEGDIRFSKIFEIVSTIESERIYVTGNADSIDKDVDKLYEFLIACANKREYILSHGATGTF